MADNDLFAPPTQEELDRVNTPVLKAAPQDDLFAPPTQAELAKTPKDQSMAMELWDIASGKRGLMDKYRQAKAQLESMSPEQIAAAQAQGAKSPVMGNPPIAIPASAAPQALLKAAEFVNKTAPRRVAAGALQGAVTNPEHPLIGAAIGAGSSFLGEGLTKGGDVGMQAAVNRSKYTPGVGTTLANEGIVGTKGAMQRQVNKALSETGEQIGELAGYIPEGSIPSPELAQNIAREHASPMIPPGGGAPSNADMAKLKMVKDFAEDVASRGAESGEQALARRMAAGRRAYRGKEDPLQSLLGGLSKSEQQQYSGAMKKAFAEEYAKGALPAAEPSLLSPFEKEIPANALAEADKKYGALKRAQASLDKEVTIPKSLMQILSTGFNVLPGGSFGASLAGQAATKSGQVLTNPVLRDALIKMAKKEKKK